MKNTKAYLTHSSFFLALQLAVTCCCMWPCLALGQAFDDTDNNGYDYITLEQNVSDNDILLDGQRTHRFLNEPQLGTITWVNTQEGIFTYLVDPLNVQTLVGSASIDARTDNIFYEVCVADFCDTALIGIFIGFRPDAPVAVNDIFYVETGALRTFDVSWNDFDSDSLSDPNRLPNRFEQKTTPIFATTETLANEPFLHIDGQFSYRSTAGYTGQDSFNYIMRDPLGCEDSSLVATVTIIILPANATPFASQVNLGAIAEESTRTQNLSQFAFDPEGESLYFRILSQGRGGLATLTNTGILSYSADTNFIGPDTLYFEVMDLVGQTASAAIVLNIYNANNDATIAPERSLATQEDEQLSQSISYIDTVDGDPLTFYVESAPRRGQASISSEGQLTYTPTLNFSGVDSLEYRSCDSANLCDVAYIVVEVTPLNDRPIVVDDFNELPINGSISGDLTPNVSDIDSPLGEISYAVLSPTSNGTLTIDANGAYTYEPFQFFYGQDTFSYTACDNASSCSTGEVFLTVTLINLAPEAVSTSLTVNEDETTLLSLEEFTSDFGTSDLIFSLLDTQQVGLFQPITNTGFSFQPTSNLFGSFLLDYRVCDTGNLCDTAQLTVNILPINDAPVAINTILQGAEDTPILWQPEYSDIDNISNEFTITSATTHGVLVGNTYQPEPNYYGADLLFYEVCDDAGACAIGTIQFLITPTNDAPFAANDTITGPEDQWLEAGVRFNDIDIDSPELTLSILPESNPFQMGMAGNGTLYWMPPTNFFGETTIAYKACDNQGACDTAMVLVIVSPVNDLPVASLPPLDMLEDGASTYDVISYAFDEEGETYIQSILGTYGVEALVAEDSSSVMILPNADFFGDASIAVTICDYEGACLIDTIYIAISPSNDSPYGSGTALTTFQNTDFNGSWGNYVADSDDPSLNFLSEAQVGTTITWPQGEFIYTPAIDFLGLDSILLHVCDTSLACIDLLFIIDVLAPNQPPIVQSLQRTSCQGVPLTIALSELGSDDTHATGQLLYSFSSPSGGEFTIDNDTQTLTITPSAFFAGLMDVTVEICDNSIPSLCASGQLMLTIHATNSPEISAITIDQISCFGNHDGRIVIEQVEEEAGVEYLWENGNTDSVQYGLGAGNYTLQIVGLSDCSTPLYAQFTITEPEPLDVSLSAQSIQTAGSGSIESTVSGGTLPYNFLWSGPQNFSSTDPMVTSLSEAGDYSLWVTDANNCLSSATTLITAINAIENASFQAYPNPTDGNTLWLNVAPEFHAGQEIRITDGAGHEISRHNILGNPTRISLSSIAPGIYYAMIVGDTLSHRVTFIVTE